MRYAPVTVMAIRMKRLPRRHRIAHLRALIRHESIASVRGKELASLLRDEMSSQPGHV